MAHWFTNFVATVVVVGAAMGLLAIGWLLVRKPLVKGSCGGNPLGTPDDSCGKKRECQFCENSNKNKNDHSQSSNTQGSKP